MESFSYPLRFGEQVLKIRNKLKMNQLEFYSFLFPNHGKEPENIKKKMNAIENGKLKSIDISFLLALCEKCHVSADYVLGLDTQYKNHEERYVCEYTGLKNKTVQKLHEWAEAKNNGADLSEIGGVWVNDRNNERANRAYAKQSAIQFLTIIDLLFVEGKKKIKGKKDGKPFSNLSILQALYTICIEKPKRITGRMDCPHITDLLQYEKYSPLYREIVSKRDSMSLDASKTVWMQDESEVYYMLDLKEILEQIGKNHLMDHIDWLIEQVKTNNKNSI